MDTLSLDIFYYIMDYACANLDWIKSYALVSKTWLERLSPSMNCSDIEDCKSKAEIFWRRHCPLPITSSNPMKFVVNSKFIIVNEIPNKRKSAHVMIWSGQRILYGDYYCYIELKRFSLYCEPQVLDEYLLLCIVNKYDKLDTVHCKIFHKTLENEVHSSMATVGTTFFLTQSNSEVYFVRSGPRGIALANVRFDRYHIRDYMKEVCWRIYPALNGFTIYNGYTYYHDISTSKNMHLHSADGIYCSQIFSYKDMVIMYDFGESKIVGLTIDDRKMYEIHDAIQKVIWCRYGMAVYFALRSQKECAYLFDVRNGRILKQIPYRDNIDVTIEIKDNKYIVNC